MTHYCVGFLFDHGYKYVSLIYKRRGPEAVKNRWNGIGGHIESGEQPEEAMAREFEEEAGLWVPPEDWENYCTILAPTFQLYVYRSSLEDPDAKLWDLVETKTDEPVQVLHCGTLWRIPRPANLQWMVHMARDQSIYTPVKVYE